MKTLLMLTLIGTSIFLSSYRNAYTSSSGSTEKLIKTAKSDKKINKSPFVGAWVRHRGAGNVDGIMGFILEKDGTAISINMGSHVLKSWKLKENKLFFTFILRGGTMSDIDIKSSITYKIKTINDSILEIEDTEEETYCPPPPFLYGVFKKDKSKTRPIVNIKNGQKITSPLNIEVNTMQIWPISDGEIGTLRLVDENNKQLGLAKIISADGYWKECSPFFKAQLTFNPKKAKSGKLIFSNEQIKKGSVVQQSFEIPVTF
jgi:hypothetical protein